MGHGIKKYFKKIWGQKNFFWKTEKLSLINVVIKKKSAKLLSPSQKEGELKNKSDKENTFCHIFKNNFSRADTYFSEWGRGAFDSAKNHKRQRRKRQSVTTKRKKSQTPKFV